jgi:lysophospholipase L1-like esterase
MADWWTRKVDILNRGFSGYNSQWGIEMFSRTVLNENPNLVLVFFGANDAVVEEVLQHVPLLNFKSNIEKMIISLQQVTTNLIFSYHHHYHHS